ncbi:MAG: oxygen-insensitive NAD(P)H nitroreductase [Rikenellaceae bacterium]
MDIIESLERRYSTKEFDAEKGVDRSTVDKLKLLLQKSPSSTNIQPWHFVMASSQEAKRRVAKATQGFYHFNESKVLAAPLVIIFASRVAAEESFMDHLSDKEEADGRYATEELKASGHAGRAIFANMHLYDLKDQQHWFEKQTYLNLGCFLLGVAALGLDALPMEGCDLKVLTEEFGLIEKGFTASFIVAVGYHAESDFNSMLPKSRLAISEIIEEL